MYRDDPLDDELELRELAGDEAVDRLLAAQPGDQEPLEVALEVLRVLQGWTDDEEAGRWFLQAQRRLGGRTPIDALVVGAYQDVHDAARAWAAARG